MELMASVVPILFALAMLWLVGRRLSRGRVLIAVAMGLALCVVVLALERSGLWPRTWR